MSVHKPPAARVTIAVLVDCERELQYFPNLDVAKSAAAASTWKGKKGKVVDGDGNYLGSDKTPIQSARQVLPRFFGSANPAVEAIFKGWTAYRNSKVMWRPNPAMPEGDVTPDECIRAPRVKRMSKHRPFFTVSATLPRDPTRPPPAAHVDPKEFPDLEQSPNTGIGGIQGSNDASKATTRGEPAFRRPIDGQGAPQPGQGVTETVTTTTTTPTTSAAPSASAAHPLNGSQHQQALVKVDRMSDAQVQAAQKATSPKLAGSTSTPKKSDSKPDSSKGEAMETDADQSTQKADTGKKSGEVTSQRRSGRSASESRSQKDTSSSRTGKTASTSSGARDQTAKSGTDKVQQALTKAGGLDPPRPDLAPIGKRCDAKGKKAVEEETHVDEAHAGALLATIYALQEKHEELKEEVRKLKAHRALRRKQLREARKATGDVQVHLDAAEKKLREVEGALQQAVRERDAARAGQPQLPAGQPQALPDQGTQQLREELDAAKQELEQHRTHRCAPTKLPNCGHSCRRRKQPYRRSGLPFRYLKLRTWWLS